VKAGATAVLLELPAGTHEIAGDKVEVTNCRMNPVHFVSRATGHPLVKDLEPDDFRFWYEPKGGCATPILERVITADGWVPILTGGKGGWAGEWTSALAACEKRDGLGVWRICNVKLSDRTSTNPVARIFARRLLG